MSAHITITQPSGRIESLDGLRGLASAVVLVGHVALTFPPLAQASELAHSGEAPIYVWLVSYTPVHLLWAGAEAVMVFFVLSGIVLTLPRTSGKRGGWLSYYASRFPRLYLPAWASLVPAVLLVILVPRYFGTGSYFLEGKVNIDPFWALSDALLFAGISPINGPLWSLYYEVIFSLVLPLYVLLARLTTRGWTWAISTAGLLLLSAAGIVLESGALQFLPVFGLGVTIAANMHRLNEVARALTPHRHVWTVVAIVSAILLTGEWLVRGLNDPPLVLVGIGRLASIIGAALIVILAIFWARFRDFLTTRSMRWLGVRSFSLYLTHVPIVVACAFLFGPDNLWAVGLIAAPLSVLWAHFFYISVERPTHRFARWLSAQIRSTR